MPSGRSDVLAPALLVLRPGPRRRNRRDGPPRRQAPPHAADRRLDRLFGDLSAAGARPRRAAAALPESSQNHEEMIEGARRAARERGWRDIRAVDLGRAHLGGRATVTAWVAAFGRVTKVQ